MRKNARVLGLLIALALVIGATILLQRSATTPRSPVGLENVPPMGQVPTREQIENRPPESR